MRRKKRRRMVVKRFKVGKYGAVMWKELKVMHPELIIW